MNNKEIIDLDSKYIMQTYGRQPIALTHGNGATIWDADGNEYLDFFAGIAVNVLGQSHSKVIEAIQKQAEKLIHVSNVYYTEEQVKLAKKLAEITIFDRIFFANSGAEANEGAIKLARKFTGKGEIIATNNSFHGRTLVTVTATGQDKYKEPFKPLPSGFIHVPFGDSKAIANAITDDTAAVLIEAIQGEGGIVVPPKMYLKEVEAICREKGVLFILDEVQTGFGRTGEMFAYELFGIKPDIMTIAKALGNGYPIGGLLARGEVAEGFDYGDHGSTFGGNPLGCAVALTVIETIKDESLLENSKNLGNYLKNEFINLNEKYDFIIDVRGFGLFLAIELDRDSSEITNKMRERGFLINSTAGNVLRFAPPLIITKEEIDKMILALDQVFSEI
ncbi:MAG: acetylornithine transaminase [Methanobrevibacter arboriphilus]|uniref:Acetylornithine aminotransferase n=1 Tax=Methanobrevibacter arboriphilus TaxID=39441 RepID=A0A843ADY0_METAZ|nr:acetylornithine transaminase [Methanobrevibacter arboriphilus]MBF4468914.1 acetylornithine transaminase [Methanobrevibacter arboriphilus]